MRWTGLHTLLSKIRRPEVAAASPILAQAQNRAAGKRRFRSFAGSCQGIVFGLIVMGGIGKSCCPGGCPPPKFDTLSFSPSSLTFAPQVVDPTGPGSPPQSVTVMAHGTDTSFPISSLTVSPDYSQTNDCPASLATGASCTVQVSFAPNAIGSIQGFLSVNGSNTGVNLVGTGSPPVGFSPASLDFGTVAPGTPSGPQTVTLTNNQSTALTISSISTSGAYSQTNNCPASLAAGLNCAIQTSFTPTVSGSVPGALTVVTDASLGTQPVSLTGTGSGSVTPSLSFSPASVAFSDQEAGTTSTAQPVTLTNTSGVATLTINSVSSSGANYLENDTCSGQVLPPGGACTINVSFAPLANLAPVSYAGAITVSDSDSTSPNVVGLSGNGVAPLTTSPPSVDFGTVFFLNTPTQTLTITNNHSAPEDLSLDAPSVFNINNSCPTSLPPGGQCSVDVQYAGDISSVKGSLAVTASSGGFLSPYLANLSACGTSVQSSPSGFNFGSVPVGTPSDPQTVTISNGLDLVSVNFTDISVAGVDAGDFSIVTNTCGSSLAGLQSCLVKTVFTPQTSGTRTATLNITDDANCSPQQISLSGGSAAGPFTITASTIGSATGTITSDLAGITCGSNGTACSASYASGSTVTLTATPDSGIVFVGWIGACSGTGSCLLNMTSDKQVRAVFGSNPVLNVSVSSVDSGAGTVTSSPAGINCGSSCSQQFNPETEVALTAHPAAGSTFAGWAGACKGTGTCTVTMLTDQTVNAQFGAPAFSVAATALNPLSISAGESATSTVTVTSLFGFKSAVSFACSVTPHVELAPTCSLENITPPANGTATGTLTIATKAPTTALGPSSNRPYGIFYAAWVALLGCVATVLAAGSKKRNLLSLFLCGLLLSGLLLQAACGGGTVQSGGGGGGSPGTPPGSYTISINGTSGALQNAAQVTLTVQ
jgi:hypothetical protein